MSEKAGRKNPPAANRFQKGKSGNPKGRPRKEPPEKGGSAFEILLNKTLTLTRNGVPHEATVEEALQFRTYADAIAGNGSAVKEVLKWIVKREAAMAKRGGPRAGIELQIEPVDPQNSNAALLILGIAGYDKTWDFCGPDGRLVIESWAVQSALRRRRGGSRLTKGDKSMIEGLMRDAASLHWRKGTPE